MIAIIFHAKTLPKLKASRKPRTDFLTNLRK